MTSDDDPLVRDALRDVLDAEPDPEVVAVARDAEEAIEPTGRHAPSVVVLDVRMPGGGGGHAAREVGLRSPGTAIVALSASTDQEASGGIRSAGVAEHLVEGTPKRGHRRRGPPAGKTGGSRPGGGAPPHP